MGKKIGGITLLFKNNYNNAYLDNSSFTTLSALLPSGILTISEENRSAPVTAELEALTTLIISFIFFLAPVLSPKDCFFAIIFPCLKIYKIRPKSRRII